MQIKALSTMVFLFIFATILFSGVFAKPAEAYDEKKFCNESLPAVIIFVDVTTKFDDRSKQLFEEGILKIMDRLSGGQKIFLATIEDSFTSSQRLYEGCVPYCPEISIIESLTSDCTSGLIRLRAKDQQRAIGLALRTRLLTATDLPKSEIIRTISFTLNSILRAGGGAEVFIFSDMIENSGFMPGKIFWSQALGDSILAIQEGDLLPVLRESKIRVFGVGRGGDAGRTPLTQVQLTWVKKFWNLYFKRAGATDIYVGESISVD